MKSRSAKAVVKSRRASRDGGRWALTVGASGKFAVVEASLEDVLVVVIGDATRHSGDLLRTRLEELLEDVDVEPEASPGRAPIPRVLQQTIRSLIEWGDEVDGESPEYPLWSLAFLHSTTTPAIAQVGGEAPRFRSEIGASTPPSLLMRSKSGGQGRVFPLRPGHLPTFSMTWSTGSEAAGAATVEAEWSLEPRDKETPAVTLQGGLLVAEEIESAPEPVAAPSEVEYGGDADETAAASDYVAEVSDEAAPLPVDELAAPAAAVDDEAPTAADDEAPLPAGDVSWLPARDFESQMSASVFEAPGRAVAVGTPLAASGEEAPEPAHAVEAAVSVMDEDPSPPAASGDAVPEPAHDVEAAVSVVDEGVSQPATDVEAAAPAAEVEAAPPATDVEAPAPESERWALPDWLLQARAAPVRRTLPEWQAATETPSLPSLVKDGEHSPEPEILHKTGTDPDLIGVADSLTEPAHEDSGGPARRPAHPLPLGGGVVSAPPEDAAPANTGGGKRLLRPLRSMLRHAKGSIAPQEAGQGPPPDASKKVLPVPTPRVAAVIALIVVVLLIRVGMSRHRTGTSAPAGPNTVRVQAFTEEDANVMAKGVEVWVDSKVMGKAPLTLELPDGLHSIRVSRGAEDSPVRLLRMPATGGHVVDFKFGTWENEPRLSLLPHAPPAMLDRVSTFTVFLNRVSEDGVTDLTLDLKGDGDWAHYPMWLIPAPGGTVGVSALPAKLLRASHGVSYYAKVTLKSGERYYTEVAAP